MSRRNLTRRFGSFTAVDRVSFAIERGEIFGFLGSNGSGKTTTMKMPNRRAAPSEGEADACGKPVDANDLSVRRRVGFMSQSFSLYGELTVRQNLRLHARLFHLAADRADERIAQFMIDVGLVDYADTERVRCRSVCGSVSLAVGIVHRIPSC